MLSNQEDFDRHVKRVLQETTVEEIPLDFLVDIEQRLDQLEKKKKRRILVWLFTGIVLASGMSFGLLREKGSSSNFVKSTKGKVSKKAVQAKAITRVDSVKENNFGQVKSVQTSAAELSGVTSNMIESSGSTVKERLIASTRVNQSDLTPSMIPTESIASVQTKITVSDSGQNSPELISNVKTEMPLSNDSLKEDSLNQNDNKYTEVNPPVNIPEIVMNIDLPKWSHSIGFFTGMSGVLSSFRTDDPYFMLAVGTTNVLKYREIRSTQERATSSIDLSLRYRMVKEHLVLQTGLDFFEWGEQIQYDYSFNYDGVNRYSYLSLPVYLGYRQAFHAFEWSANIGCSLGHVLQQKGRYIQPDLVSLALENARTWTATGMAQVEFIYIFDRYRFTLAPTYRMSLGNVVNSTFTKNRYFSFGLQMGMAYQF
ncbi:MAG: hypothetical protein RLZZ531_1495 [Bacteroidota bacterium]|jgi:hypothetical protein